MKPTYSMSFKCRFLLLCSLLFSYSSFAQYTIHFRVKPASTHSGDTVFVAGSFNEWNPGNEKYRLTRTGDVLTIDIPGLQKDIYQFKFTRGNWSTPEVTAAGADIENRIIKLESDTTLEYTIGGWKDDFPSAPRSHTASINVRLLDTAFFIPQLNRTRRVWIYLPEGYATGKIKSIIPFYICTTGKIFLMNLLPALGNGVWMNA